MLNFLGPLRKASSSSTPPPSPSPSPTNKEKKATPNEADKSESPTVPVVANCSTANGELPKRKVEFKSDLLVGANGTIPGGVLEAEAPVLPPGVLELAELKQQASGVANESLMSTRRMAELCENAKDAGIKIIVALDDQKEQLDRVQDSLTGMREDLIQAESNIRGMEKCCGIFDNPFKKSTFKEDETLWKDAGDGVVTNSSIASRMPTTLGWGLNKNSSSNSSNSGPGPGSGFSVGYIPRITEDKVEEEMDKNMDLVSSMLGNLRNMAIDMNTEIESQNKQMNIINDMTEQNNARIDDAIQRTHDLKR